MFAKHHVFTVENGQLVPVRYPDPQRLDELPGYEQEREKVIANTRALLAGMPANNVLLYGDAGTGKSQHPLQWPYAEPRFCRRTACASWKSRRTSSIRSPI